MSIASKNLFELLGNDPDENGDIKPVIPVEKPLQRVGKRNGTGEPAPKAAEPVASRGGASGRGGRGGRRDGNASANERAFRDREAGHYSNRDKPTDDDPRRTTRQPRGERGRGPKGARVGIKDDRHSKSGIDEHPKQAEKGWGEETAAGELADERAGDAMAAEEERTGFDTNPDKPVNAEGETFGDPEVEEDKSKSYTDYLAELAEKKLQLGGSLEARKANEGGKGPEGKAFTSEEQEYFVGSGGKAQRERVRKEKNFLALDHDIQARERDNAGGRGGRGGGRGGRGRGEGGFRGDGRGRGGRGGARGDRGDRGDRADRGDRGDCGDRSDRGASRGGARGGAPVNVTDSSAFPSLGS